MNILATPIGELIERDRWGRPLIADEHTGKKTAYRRVSTIAKNLDDNTALEQWKISTTVKGVIQNPAYYTRLISLLPTWENSKSTVSEILKMCLDFGGGGDAATIGTSLHDITRYLDHNTPIKIPTEYKDHITAYQEAMKNITVLDTEVFIINDEYLYAGSFDKLVKIPGEEGVFIADLKTGTYDADYPSSVTTQTAMYANGQRYDPDTWKRILLHENIRLDKAILIHLPVKKGPECNLYLLDIKRGFERAKACLATYKAPTITKKHATRISI